MAALKLCILSSEIMPYAKTGGLADVTGALVHELALLGHEVRPFMPLYASVRRLPDMSRVAGAEAVPLDIGGVTYEFSLWSARGPDGDPPMWIEMPNPMPVIDV